MLSRAACVTVVAMLSVVVSCDLRPGHCWTDEQFAVFRETEFPIYAKGFSYLATTEILGVCEPLLTPEEAYPGIDTSGEPGTQTRPFWAGIVVQRVVSLSWQSPGSPDPAGMLFLTPFGSENWDISDQGLEPGPHNDEDVFQPRMFLNVFPYDGAADGALDAQFVCDDDGTLLSPDNAFVIRRYLGETEHVFELTMGDHIDVLMRELEDEYASPNAQAPSPLSQENFVFPRQKVIDVVGTVSEIPPLPDRPETSLCGV